MKRNLKKRAKDLGPTFLPLKNGVNIKRAFELRKDQVVRWNYQEHAQ